jgi:hypothetical protein
MILRAMRALLLVLSAFACVASESEGAAPKKADEREIAAENYLKDLEETFAKLHALTPAQRLKGEEQLEAKLEKALDKAEKTRLENKALFLLASWRFTYRNGDDVEDLLTRLSKTGFPAYQNFARQLQIQVDLKNGRLATARERATKLAQDVPEFSSNSALVSFYERIGKKPAKTAGRNLVGGAPDPSVHAEPWLLYVFVDALEGDDAFLLRRFTDELKLDNYRGKMRLVCVTYAVNPLPATIRFQNDYADNGAELLWASPNEDGDAAQWTSAWGVPGIPASALLGPDRSLMAVQCNPAELRPLVGAKSQDKPKKTEAPSSDQQRRKWGKGF